MFSLLSSAAEGGSALSHLAHLWPEFLLAWAGWLVHSFVHNATHVASKGIKLVIGYLKSR